MSNRQEWGRGGRSASGRTLFFLVVLLPPLLLGQALGGMAAWLHSHGPSGEHMHLLTEQVVQNRHGTLHDWHDAQHRHEHEDDTREQDEPTPVGLRIDLPRILAVPGSGAIPAPADGIHVPALLPMPRWHLALVEGTHRHELRGSGWQPQWPKRTGVAALLRSSHAILI